MKNSWSIYAIVAVVSVLAAVAIAGTPQSITTEPTISVPVATASTTTLALAEVEATEPVAASTTAPVVVSTTTLASTTTTSTLPEIERADVAVVAVNGANVAGIASRVRSELDELGYTRARPTDGLITVDETTVHFFPGFDREAELVAADLGIDPSRIGPVADAPSFGALDVDQVIVYLGRDRR